MYSVREIHIFILLFNFDKFIISFVNVTDYTIHGLKLSLLIFYFIIDYNYEIVLNNQIISFS